MPATIPDGSWSRGRSGNPRWRSEIGSRTRCVSGWLSVDLASKSVRAATSEGWILPIHRSSGRVANGGGGFRVGLVIEFTKLAFPLIYIWLDQQGNSAGDRNAASPRWFPGLLKEGGLTYALAFKKNFFLKDFQDLLESPRFLREKNPRTHRMCRISWTFQKSYPFGGHSATNHPKSVLKLTL